MTSLNADKALQELLAGNQRYMAGRLTHPHQTADYRQGLIEHQAPFAIILGCSDSRVPPEIIFDQGLGDLFVVRVAGNVMDDAVLASLEYAAEHLKTPLLIVLGHKGCGAVQATVDALAANQGGAGHMRFLVNAIQPAVEDARSQGGVLADNVIRANVQRIVKHLKLAEPILFSRVRDHKLKIVGGFYDLESGKVEMISEAS